jgi:hypothetical protein
MTAPTVPFFSEIARLINSGQTRSLVVHGNVHDLFPLATTTGSASDYVPLVEFLTARSAVPGVVQLVYELNGPIRVLGGDGWEKLRQAWTTWKSGVDADTFTLQSLTNRARAKQRQQIESDFDATVQDAVGKPTVAMEFLRQLTVCTRSRDASGRPLFPEKLLIFVEAADTLLPAGSGEDLASLNPADRHRVNIAIDWFGESGFMNGKDSVVLVAESRSLLNPRVLRLPSVLDVEVPRPDAGARRQFIDFFLGGAGRPEMDRPAAPTLWGSPQDLADMTAGLSIHALRQLLVGAAHRGEPLRPGDVVGKVEQFIASELGEDVIEFKRPTHTLGDVVGFSRLKRFIADELLPRMRSTGEDALSGAAIAGPIGGGKTFIFEAAAAELALPVLVLKNIRSQWFGQTDVIFERLRSVLESLGRVVIFVDEADTQFGGVGADAHETERRLTGKVQQMMSDARLRGKVTWLLMTARIHALSADIRRPGRAGDLIIPVLDPEGDDHLAFVRWMLERRVAGDLDPAVQAVAPLCQGWSAASFSSMRSTLKAAAREGPLPLERVKQIIGDHIPPAIGSTRRYQTLQALINCTRRSLLPDPAVSDGERESWQAEIRALEAQGLR